MSDTSSKFVFAETDLATLKLVNLVPNTQYSLYATAVINVKDNTVESEPSETLIAWTDPAFPAFVEVRIVKARNNKFANFVSFSLRNYFVVRSQIKTYRHSPCTVNYAVQEYSKKIVMLNRFKTKQ